MYRFYRVLYGYSGKRQTEKEKKMVELTRAEKNKQNIKFYDGNNMLFNIFDCITQEFQYPDKVVGEVVGDASSLFAVLARVADDVSRQRRYSYDVVFNEWLLSLTIPRNIDVDEYVLTSKTVRGKTIQVCPKGFTNFLNRRKDIDRITYSVITEFFLERQAKEIGMSLVTLHSWWSIISTTELDLLLKNPTQLSDIQKIVHNTPFFIDISALNIGVSEAVYTQVKDLYLRTYCLVTNNLGFAYDTNRDVERNWGLYEVYRDKIRNKGLEKAIDDFRGLNGKKISTIDNYIIVVPQTAADFIDEGRQQNNCIGDFIDAAIDGDSMPLWIRKADTPQTSFMTVLFDCIDGYISEFRYKNNCEVDDALGKQLVSEAETAIQRHLNIFI